METYTLKTGKVGEHYFIFVPKNTAKWVTTHHTDNYNCGYTNTLGEGVYAAMLLHEKHSTEPHKYWEIQESDMDCSIELEDERLRGVLAVDLKQLLT